MYAIADISRQIQKNLDAGTPLLRHTPLDTTAAAAEIVGSVVDPATFSLMSADLNATEDHVLVEGEADLLGFPKLHLCLGYANIAGEIFFVVKALLPGFEPLELLNKLKSPVSSPTLVWRYGPLIADRQEASWIPATSHVEFSGRLDLPGLTLPVIVHPPLSDNAWELTGDFRLLPLTSLKPLVKWIAGSIQAPQLPPGLDGLDALALSGLSLRFDAGRAEVVSAAVSLSTTAPWELVGEHLVLDQVCLSLSYLRDPENNAVNVSAVAAGLLRVGKQAMEVSVGTDSASGITFVRMLAEDFRLPDLSDLAGILGQPDLFKSLPPTLMKAADLFLNAFTLEIDGGNRKLSLLYAALACPQTVEFEQGMSLENVAFDLCINPDAATPVTARLSALLAVGEEYMPLQGLLAEVLSFSGSMPSLPLSQLAQRFFPGLAGILPDVELSEIEAQIDSAGVVDLSARASIDLHELAGRLEFVLPDGVGAVDLSVLALQADMAAGSWTLTIGSSDVYRFPEREANYLQLSEVSVSFSDDGFSCSFVLAGDFQPTAPRDDVLVTMPPLKVHYASQTRQWSVVPIGEGVRIKAFWFDMQDCEASIQEGIFRLRYAHPLPLADFGALGSARIDRFDCMVTKETDGDATLWGFGVEGRGRLEIGDSLLDTDFEIGLVATPEEKKLVLAVQQPNPIRFSPGPAAGSQPLLELALSTIRLEADSKHKTWSFQAHATGALRDIPEAVKGYFPATLPEGNFRVDDKGITFDCELPPGMLRPECRLFSVNVEGTEIVPAITVPRFGARLGGKDSNVHCILHVELPEALNYLFGGSHGKPNIVFLNPSFDLMLSIGKQVRLALANGTSPLKNLEFRDDHDGQGPYFLANFGAGFNTFRINVPELNYAGNSWAGSAGMTVLDPPIKIPLTPLKFILRQLKVPQQIIKYIPDSVPIDVVDFKKNKTFRSVLEKVLQKSAVAALYGPKSSARTVLEAVDTVWRKIVQLIARMPKDFQVYAEPPDIRKLNIRLGATPGGGWSGGLETDGRHAVSFMLPMVGFMPPELVGLSLRSLAFGQSAGGLATFKIDGCIDRFDVVMLAIAIGSIATDAKALLSPGEVEQLANHTELQNVFGIALPAFPIPIPLLFDEISWRYKNWWGLGGQAKGKLQLGPDTTVWTVLETLIPFVFDREYKLQDHPEKGPKLSLQIGPDNLQLPKFLGGGIMGPEAGSPEMPADYSIRFLLDAFKFTNPAYAIQAIPLRHPESGRWIRLGSRQVNFGPLGFKAGWCITTEDEFRNQIVPDKDAQKLLGELDADAVLDNLPAKSGPAYDKGFIALLMGRGGLAGILEFETNFGMAVTSTGGFETELMMQGRIADLISLSLYGLVEIRQDGGTTVEGGCSLKFDKTEIIGSTHTITVTDHSFELEAELRLLDVVTLAGDFYIGQDQVYLKGSFSWGYAKGQAPMAALGVFARFNNTGFEIGVGAANLFGTKCAELILYLDVTRKTPIGARASLDDLTGLNEKLGLSLKSFQAEIDKAAADTKSLMDKAMADLSGNIEGFEDLRKKLPDYLNTLRTATIPKTINAGVKSAYKSLSGWQKKAVSEATIRKNVQAYYQKNFAGLIKSLEDALRNVEGADEAAKNAQTRKLLQNTLQKVIDIRKIQYTYKKKVVLKTFSKKITISDPVKPYRKQLEHLKNVIGKLPDSWDKADTAKAAHAANNRIKQVIDKVAENIDKQIPMIESVQLDLPVAFTAPAVDAHVKMQYAGKTRLLKPVLLDLGNPVKSIDSITEAFADLLSADAG